MSSFTPSEYFENMRNALDRYEKLYSERTRFVALKMIFRNIKFIIKNLKLHINTAQRINGNCVCATFDIDGGLGDLLINLNYIQNFAHTFSENVKIYINVPKRFLEETKTFLAGHKFVSKVDSLDYANIQGCDIYIRLVRIPIVKYVNQSRLSILHPELLDWANKNKEFCRLHSEYVKTGSVSDGLLSQYSLINGQNRLTQADVIKYFSLNDKFQINLKKQDQYLAKFQLEKDKYIALQGGCGIVSKAKGQNITTREWDINKFSKLISLLRNKYPNYKFVQIGYDNGLYMQGTDYNLCGKTNFEELLSLVNGAKLLISTESGVVHFRHFMSQKQSVVLFGPTKIDMFGYDENINISAGVCDGCEWIHDKWREVCLKSNSGSLCMKQLTPEFVMKKIGNISL